MKTSALIEVNAAKLHSVLNSNKSAMHRPEIIRELEGLIAYLEEFAPSTKKYGDSLLDAAYRYYGSGAHLLAKDEQNDLLKEMRTSISLIAVQKSQYARSDD